MAIITLNNNSLSSVTSLPAAIPTGKVLQVVQSTFTTKFQQTINGSSPQTLNNGSSDIGVSITPASSSNKVLVTFNLGRITAHNSSDGYGLAFALQRGGTPITGAVNTDGGNTPPYTWFAGSDSLTYDTEGVSFSYLDSPSSTSSQTYTLKTISHTNSNYVITINGYRDSATQTYNGYMAGAITMVQAMEVAA
jgi:hypothetical protein